MKTPEIPPVNIVLLTNPFDKSIAAAQYMETVAKGLEGIDVWRSDNITPGGNWRDVIETHIQKAHVVLPFISAYALGHELVIEQIQRANVSRKETRGINWRAAALEGIEDELGLDPAQFLPYGRNIRVANLPHNEQEDALGQVLRAARDIGRVVLRGGQSQVSEQTEPPTSKIWSPGGIPKQPEQATPSANERLTLKHDNEGLTEQWRARERAKIEEQVRQELRQKSDAREQALAERERAAARKEIEVSQRERAVEKGNRDLKYWTASNEAQIREAWAKVGDGETGLIRQKQEFHKYVRDEEERLARERAQLAAREVSPNRLTNQGSPTTQEQVIQGSAETEAIDIVQARTLEARAQYLTENHYDLDVPQVHFCHANDNPNLVPAIEAQFATMRRFGKVQLTVSNQRAGFEPGGRPIPEIGEDDELERILNADIVIFGIDPKFNNSNSMTQISEVARGAHIIDKSMKILPVLLDPVAKQDLPPSLAAHSYLLGNERPLSSMSSAARASAIVEMVDRIRPVIKSVIPVARRLQDQKE